MTLKDKVAEVCPEKISDRFLCGVFGCPADYDFLGEPLRDLTNQTYCTDVDCDDCWAAEYKGPTKEG